MSSGSRKLFPIAKYRAARLVSLGMRSLDAAVKRPREFAAALDAALRSNEAKPLPASQANRANSASVAPPLDASKLDPLPSDFLNPFQGIMPMCEPLNVRTSPELNDVPHLNVLLPGVQMRAMSGGPNTAIALTYRLAESGIPVRYFSVNATPDADQDPIHRHFMTISGVGRRLDNVSIVDANDRSGPAVIGRNDLFFATAWWTAQMVKNALPLMRTKKFIYFIQDFEPGLHEFSSYYALAMETYGLDFLPLINHPILARHYIEGAYGSFADPEFAERAIVIDPAIDSTRFYCERSKRSGPRRLLFYTRPRSGIRNMFELGVVALRKAVADGYFDSDDWRFEGIGEDFPPVDLGKGMVLEPSPWRNFEQYAANMRSADMILSLMLAPHPSYPPLEMAACGGMVVTNTFSCKTSERLAAISSNIVARAPTVDGISGALGEAVMRLADLDAREKASKLSCPSNWIDSFKVAEPALKSFWSEQTGAHDHV